MRLLKFALAGVVLLFIQTIILLLRQKIHIAAASGGAVCGVLLSIIVLMRSFGLAKKGTFVDKPSHRDRRIVFFVIFPLAFFLGGLMFFVQKHYFTELDISKASTTAATFFIFIFCVIEAAGIYVLERRYGKKFYMGK